MGSIPTPTREKEGRPGPSRCLSSAPCPATSVARSEPHLSGHPSASYHPFSLGTQPSLLGSRRPVKVNFLSSGRAPRRRARPEIPLSLLSIFSGHLLRCVPDLTSQVFHRTLTGSSSLRIRPNLSIPLTGRGQSPLGRLDSIPWLGPGGPRLPCISHVSSRPGITRFPLLSHPRLAPLAPHPLSCCFRPLTPHSVEFRGARSRASRQSPLLPAQTPSLPPHGGLLDASAPLGGSQPGRSLPPLAPGLALA